MTGVAEVLRRLVRWLREHPFAADTALAIFITVLAMAFHLTDPEIDADDPARDPTWWTAALLVASTMPIMFRRVRPIATLVAVATAQAVCELFEIVGPGWLAVLVAVYSLGAHTEGRRRTVTLVVVGVPMSVLLVTGLLVDEVTVVDAIATVGTFTAAYVLGDNLRRRRAHVEALADRAERAERERDLLARERVAEERARIAREMHDIVAHSVSVMVIQAAAARRQLDHRPDLAATLLESLERTGRATMDELRQVLGVLRDPDAQRLDVPVPTLAELPALVEAVNGLPVRLSMTGDVDHVPAGVAVSVYRVVQEALTNATRHAGPGATVAVRVASTPSAVDVVVEDDGRGASATPSANGYGLLGMNERASAAGGTFVAGPRPGGGWRVAASFPVPAVTAPRLVS